jgi:hypothetical protein
MVSNSRLPRGFPLGGLFELQLKKKGWNMEELDSATLQFIEYNVVIGLIGLIGLVFTVIYSFKKGSISEIGENFLLWFLLFGGISFISTYPVAEDDQITGGIFFIAFGLCRIAKHMAKKTESN